MGYNSYVYDIAEFISVELTRVPNPTSRPAIVYPSGDTIVAMESFSGTALPSIAAKFTYNLVNRKKDDTNETFQ
jgi:hypothetical protein